MTLKKGFGGFNFWEEHRHWYFGPLSVLFWDSGFFFSWISRIMWVPLYLIPMEGLFFNQMTPEKLQGSKWCLSTKDPCSHNFQVNWAIVPVVEIPEQVAPSHPACRAASWKGEKEQPLKRVQHPQSTEGRRRSPPDIQLCWALYLACTGWEPPSPGWEKLCQPAATFTSLTAFTSSKKLPLPRIYQESKKNEMPAAANGKCTSWVLQKKTIFHFLIAKP